MAAMTMAVAELPDDVDALKAMIVAMAEQRALLEARTSHLEVVNKTADERIATLTAIVRMLERSRYGTRSERLRRDIERRAARLRVRRNQDRPGGDRSRARKHR
jgi:transposase